jgi:hypothetical protein
MSTGGSRCPLLRSRHRAVLTVAPDAATTGLAQCLGITLEGGLPGRVPRSPQPPRGHSGVVSLGHARVRECTQMPWGDLGGTSCSATIDGWRLDVAPSGTWER